MPAVCLIKAVAKETAQPRKGVEYELEVTDEAKSLLQSDAFNDRPLLVVSIAGPARTGKSTLLNCILRQLGQNISCDDGFEVGHSVKDVTEGVWLWPEPVVLNNTQHRLVLLDIEGCDSLQKNADVTNGLYCLGYTLSSVMMWNLRGTLNESFRTQLVRMAHATSIIIPPEDARSFGNTGVEPARHALASVTNKLKSVSGWNRWKFGGGNDDDDDDDEADEAGYDDDTKQLDQELAEKERQAHMKAVGRNGPDLVVVLRDFNLELETTPREYLQTALQANRTHTKKQRLGAEAASSLFRSEDIVLFRQPPKLEEPEAAAAVRDLSNKLAQAQPRDVLKQSSKPEYENYLTGKLLCNFLCELVEHINAKGMLQLDMLGRHAVMRENDAVLRTIEANFEQLASMTLDNFMYNNILASPKGLADFRKSMRDGLTRSLDGYKPSGPNEIQEQYRQQLQCLLEERLQVWEDRASQRHDSMMAQELSVYTSRVAGEIRAVAHEYLPGTSIISSMAAERIWDKVVEPTVHKLLSEDALYENSKEEIKALLQQERIGVLKRQEQINKELAAQAVGRACMIKGTDVRKLIVHLDREGFVRGVRAAVADNQPNMRHLFLTRTGGLLSRLPKEDDEVAVYSIADRAVWKVKYDGEGFWGGKPKYVLRSLEWSLGDTSLPTECLFQVHAKGNNIMLHGLGSGFVIRRYPASAKMANAKYRLGKADGSSKFELTSAPMSFAEKAAFEAVIKGVMRLAVEPGTAAMHCAISSAIEHAMKN